MFVQVTTAAVAVALGLVLAFFLDRGSNDSLERVLTRLDAIEAKLARPARSQPVALLAAKRITPLDPVNLRHVDDVLARLGYRVVRGAVNASHSDLAGFTLLWTHEYPFSDPVLRPAIDRAEGRQQIVNHVPGSGFYTSKVALATAGILGTPLAFRLSRDRKKFEAHVAERPGSQWVQKSNAHRNIRVLPVEQLELDKADTFVQQFIDNPLLIDGKKFDIGIYTVITSLDPLRVYVYDGDVLLRFCAKPYEPFDADDVDRYVVGDDYTPIWEMPSLKALYRGKSSSTKHALDAIVAETGRDPSVIWEQIRDIIGNVFEKQQSSMLKAAGKVHTRARMFELSRFDFVVDAELKVYLMEANMSPNLSSGHFAGNKLLYERVIFNVLSLVGLATSFSPVAPESEVEVSDRDLVTSSCLAPFCEDCPVGGKEDCSSCPHCWTPGWRRTLRETFLEQINRRFFRRILPRSEDSESMLGSWLTSKCTEDARFCA